MDTSHFPWTHTGVLGVEQNPEVPDTTIQPVDGGFQYELEVEVPVSAIARAPTYTRRRYDITLPFMITIHTWLADGTKSNTLFFIGTPLSLTETKFYFHHFVGSLHSQLTEEQVAERFNTILEQDRAIVEAQRPELLPLDLREELHLRGPDTAALEYRQQLRGLGVDWG